MDNQSNILSIINFLELLNDDLYTTFLGTYLDQKCIVKFFTHKSDENNEYEVIQFLKTHSDKSNLYPKPYFQIKDDIGDYSVTLANVEHKLHSVYKVICYEYFDGVVGTNNYNKFDDLKALMNLKEHLNDIHSFGFIFADVRPDNIIFSTKLDRYILIDYGRTFHSTYKLFPPMDYMLEEKEFEPLMIQDDDTECLQAAIRIIKYVE